MSEDKFHNTPKTRFKSLCDLNFLGLWSQCGIDWSSMIKEEIKETINQPIEEKKSKPTKKVVRFSILTTLALLGTGIWIQAPKNYQTAQEISRNSVEKLTIRQNRK